MPIKQQCTICSKEFLTYPSRVGRVSTCSVACGGLKRRRRMKKTCQQCGDPFEVRASKEERLYCSKDCYGLSNRESENYLWKGGSATYRTKHKWVERRLGKARLCEMCGLSQIPEGKKRYFDWANISGEYLRDLNDWKQLCKLCHRAFDIARKHTIV